MDPKLINRLSWLVLAFAIVFHIVSYARFARANAPTYDEGVHLAAGYRMWQCGNFAINPEHPPLAKFIAATPIHNWPIPALNDNCRGSVANYVESFKIGFFLENGAASAEMFRKARLALLPFTLMLLILLYIATRECFGPVAAALAALLYVFEPSITAHAAPVTTDMAMAALMFASIVGTWWWLDRPSWRRTAVLALCLGLVVASKISGLIVPPIVLILMLLGRRFHPEKHSAPSAARVVAHWAIAGAASYIILWSAYLFRFYAAPASTHADYSLVTHPLLNFCLRHHLLPESYLAGFNVIATARDSVYLLGRIHPSGVWYYFPVAMSIKTTLPLLLFIAAALVLIRMLWKSNPRAVLFALVPVVVYLVPAMRSPLNMGIRHLLPIYPFLIVLAAGAAAHLIARYRTSAAVVVSALLVWQCSAFVASSPYHLSYANEAYGGRDNLYKSLAVDWGEATYLVTDWSQNHRSTPCLIAWLAPATPRTSCTMIASLAGDAFDLLPPPVPARFQGSVLISTTLYQSPTLPYREIFTKPPSQVIEGSILVFTGDFDLARLSAFQHLLRARWALRHAQSTAAVAECRQVDPALVEPAAFNLIFGAALLSDRLPDEAEPRLQIAYKLASADPKLAAIATSAANLLRQIQTSRATPGH